MDCSHAGFTDYFACCKVNVNEPLISVRMCIFPCHCSCYYYQFSDKRAILGVNENERRWCSDRLGFFELGPRRGRRRQVRRGV